MPTAKSMTVNESRTRRARVTRIRIAQAILAVLAVSVAAFVAGLNPFTEWWFWTSVSVVLATAVVEPYFTGPTSALVFGLSALGAGIAADRTGVETLWVFFFLMVGTVIGSSLLAMAAHEGRWKIASGWVATRLGRPLWLGLSIVAIEMIRLSFSWPPSKVTTVVTGFLVALIVAVPDWYKFLTITQGANGSLATVEAAVDPNLLLVSEAGRMQVGQSVRLTGIRNATGVVTGNLAHKSGNRVQIALSRPWTDVVDTGGSLVEIQPEELLLNPVGLVVDGTTDKSLSIRPLAPLSRGDAIYWEDEKLHHQYIYQILGLELRDVMWDGSATLSERALAGVLGALNEDGIVPGTKLPPPHTQVFDASQISSDLPAGFTQIGTISGTQIPVGVSAESLRHHHLAILGMSGMGKSTIARKLIDILATGSTVVALDGTGEYRSRFQFQPWQNPAGFVSTGSWVHEPIGVQSLAASQFIEQAMDAANAEYQAGAPSFRTLLLEEAHSFLPEWNFTAQKGESDNVANSCRYILQARKFGLSFILVSQRTAVISKSALSQCESYVIFRTLDDTSLQYVEGVLGREFREVATSLEKYQAVCVGPAFNTSTPVVVNIDSNAP